ncbi:MAG TPA: polysaccharide deacetylase family protein [Hyphomicrobium sp.]|nr:polysaccharide deacetylase family protein [Hyphomicrobium sp.]
MQRNSVLHDPSGWRRRFVNVGGLVIAVAAITLVIVGYRSFANAPHLERDGDLWRMPRTLIAAVSDNSKSNLSPTLNGTLSRAVSPEASQVTRIAFFDVHEMSAFAGLKDHASSLDAIFPNFLTIDPTTKRLARISGESEERLHRRLQKQAPALSIYPILSNELNYADAVASMSSEGFRAQLVDDVRNYLHTQQYAGIVLDLNELPWSSFGYVLDFVYRLTDAVRPEGRKVIVLGSPNPDKAQLQQLAAAADYVVTPTDRAIRDPKIGGPLAAQSDFEATLRDYLETVDPKKIIVAAGSFACDGVRGQPCKKISVQSAWNTAQRAGAAIAFDQKSLNSRFSYVDELGRSHDVWLLDGVTLFNQAKVALAQLPGGLALSAIGLEDPTAWSILARGRVPDASALADLRVLPQGRSFDEALESQIVNAAPEGSSGSRTVSYNEELGLIVDQKFSKIPVGQIFSGWDASDKNLLAITFDDGPDEINTGLILDVLAEKGVPATFFVIGQNALQHPEVLKRMYEAGHDIGNHTFSHPRLSDIAEWQMHYELNASQRVLEMILGIDTRLFRPPYNGSVLSDQADNAAVIAEVSRLGYATVLSGAHGWDWLNPKPEFIHDEIVKGVLSGNGQIILLHDKGERSNTLAALPRIIDTLRAHGFRFGTIHELLHKDRSQVMPPYDPARLASEGKANGGYGGIIAYQSVSACIAALAMLIVFLNVTRLIFTVGGTLVHQSRERERANRKFWPSSVAVIIPAFNEELVICKTIRSILGSSRSDFEVIVVDDGSTDNTAAVAAAAFANDPRVKVFKKPNGGKADTANFALAHTEAEVVIAIDADGVLGHDAIELMVRHFEDPRVGAVAGTAIVGNKGTWLTRFQDLEYMVGQYLDRRALTLFNANSVVPGAIGAWRREALLQIGGYATDTVAEDCDATFSVIRKGWLVLYEPAAETRTEAPETLHGLMKQRRRWMFGMLQVLCKNIDAIRVGPTSLGWLTMPHVLCFGYVVALVTPLLVAAFMIQSGVQILQWRASTDPEFNYQVSVYLKWWIFLSIADLIVISAALYVAGIKDILQKIPLIILQRIIYLPILYWIAFETVFAALKGKIVRWNKLNRTGTVSVQQTAIVTGTT